MNETGRGVLHVRPFPPTGADWVVSDDGTTPMFSSDGRELFYPTSGVQMVLPVSTSGTFTIGVPRRLFEIPIHTMLISDTTRS